MKTWLKGGIFGVLGLILISLVSILLRIGDKSFFIALFLVYPIYKPLVYFTGELLLTGLISIIIGGFIYGLIIGLIIQKIKSKKVISQNHIQQ